MRTVQLLPWFAGVAIIAACSGKAIVDPPTESGTGGSTSSSSSSSSSGSTSSGTTTPTSTSTSSSGTVSCDSLKADFDAALESALSCDPWINMIQCTGELMVLDACGCAVAANEHYPELAGPAGAAYDAWADAGCGPWDCDWCADPDGPWACIPAADGQSGSCGYAEWYD